MSILHIVERKWYNVNDCISTRVWLEGYLGWVEGDADYDVD